MAEGDAAAQTVIPSESLDSLSPEETGYTESNESSIRWRNTWRYLTGGLTAEGMKQYDEGRDKFYEKKHIEKAERDRDWLLAYSTIPIESTGGIGLY